MAVEAFYFSHDYNARADRKMMALQMSLGMEGVGIYWCIVEMLYEEGGSLKLSECERIAFELRTDKERINKVVNSFDLFVKDKIKFWSESVLRRLGERHERSEKARESAKKRWNNANAMRTHSEGNANQNQNQNLKGREEGVPTPEAPRATATHLADVWPKGLTTETWAEWRKHLNCRGKAFTPPQEKQQLHRLAEHADPDRIVRDAIAAGHGSLPPAGGWPSQQQRKSQSDKNAAVAAAIFGSKQESRDDDAIDSTAQRVA